MKESRWISKVQRTLQGKRGEARFGLLATLLFAPLCSCGPDDAERRSPGRGDDEARLNVDSRNFALSPGIDGDLLLGWPERSAYLKLIGTDRRLLRTVEDTRRINESVGGLEFEDGVRVELAGRFDVVLDLVEVQARPNESAGVGVWVRVSDLLYEAGTQGDGQRRFGRVFDLQDALARSGAVMEYDGDPFLFRLTGLDGGRHFKMFGVFGSSAGESLGENGPVDDAAVEDRALTSLVLPDEAVVRSFGRMYSSSYVAVEILDPRRLRNAVGWIRRSQSPEALLRYVEDGASAIIEDGPVR